jgi:hypothetical protein
MKARADFAIISRVKLLEKPTGGTVELYFDCLKCGAVTQIQGRRLCARCGGSTGVVAKTAGGAVMKPPPAEKANADRNARKSRGIR